MEVDQINSSANKEAKKEQQDSEAEEEEEAFQKSKFSLTFELDESKIPAGSLVFVLNSTCPKALVRILFDDSLAEFGKVEAMEEKYKEPKACIKFHTVKNFVFLTLEEGYKGTYSGQIMNKIWPSFQSKGCTIVGLSQVYKTNYTAPDGGAIEIDSGKPLPLRYSKSSHQNQAIDAFLTGAASMQLDVAPDTAFGANGGLIASFLANAEMYGTGAITFKAIMDEHVITTEGMKAYAPIVIGLMGLKDAKMDELYSYKTFRPVLKELNAKSHGIFN